MPTAPPDAFFLDELLRDFLRGGGGGPEAFVAFARRDLEADPVVGVRGPGVLARASGRPLRVAGEAPRELPPGALPPGRPDPTTYRAPDPVEWAHATQIHRPASQANGEAPAANVFAPPR